MNILRHYLLIIVLSGAAVSPAGAAKPPVDGLAKSLNVSIKRTEHVIGSNLWNQLCLFNPFSTWEPIDLKLSYRDTPPKPWPASPNGGGIHRAAAIFRKALARLQAAEKSGTKFDRRSAAHFLAYYAWFEAAYAYQAKTFPYVRMRKLVLAACKMDKNDPTALWMRGMLQYWRHAKILKFMSGNVEYVMPSINPIYGKAALKYINRAVKAGPQNCEAWLMRLDVESAMATFHNRMSNDAYDPVADHKVSVTWKNKSEFFFDLRSSMPPQKPRGSATAGNP